MPRKWHGAIASLQAGRLVVRVLARASHDGNCEIARPGTLVVTGRAQVLQVPAGYCREGNNTMPDGPCTRGPFTLAAGEVSRGPLITSSNDRRAAGKGFSWVCAIIREARMSAAVCMHNHPCAGGGRCISFLLHFPLQLSVLRIRPGC